MISVDNEYQNRVYASSYFKTFGSRYSRMDQVKFPEDSL